MKRLTMLLASCVVLLPAASLIAGGNDPPRAPGFSVRESVGRWSLVNPAGQRFFSTVRPDAGQGVPPAPVDPFASFAPGLALKHWDRERGFDPAASEFPAADLYLCWNPQALYLAVWALDFAEDSYYSSKQIPKQDRALWTVQAGEAPEIRARIGTGREPLINDADLRIENLSGVNLKVRNIAILEIPARRLGRPVFKAGDTVDLSSTLLTHARAYRMEWKGNFTLRE